MIFSNRNQFEVPISLVFDNVDLSNFLPGAKFYYLRAILHGFPDDKCRSLLENIISAMNEDSVILIDDMIFPDANVHWQAVQFDLTMMCAHASMARTLSQWGALLYSVGLIIRDIYVYNFVCHETVVAVVPVGGSGIFRI